MTSGTGEFLLTTVGAGMLEAEERGDGTTIKYRWSFTTTEDLNPRREARRQDKLFSRLTGFSGAAVRSSPFTEKILTWKLVPFTGWLVKPQPAWEMALEGVPD